MLRPVRGRFKPKPGRLLNLNNIHRGLIGAYFFNEGGGLTITDAVQGVTGAFSNGPTWTQGPFGPAINFSGSTTSIQGTTRVYDPKSWAFWINDADSTTYTVAYKSDNNGSHGWWLDHSGAGIVRGLSVNSGADTVFTSNAAPAGGIWHFFVFTYDGALPASSADGQWYADGLAIATSLSAAGSGVHNSDDGQILQIGAGGTGGSIGALNFLDSLLMWNRVLTAKEVQDLYVATFPATQAHRTPKPGAATKTFAATATAKAAALGVKVSITLAAAHHTFQGALTTELVKFKSLAATAAQKAGSLTVFLLPARIIAAQQLQMSAALGRKISISLAAAHHTFAGALSATKSSGHTTLAATATAKAAALNLKTALVPQLTAAKAQFSAKLTLVASHGPPPPPVPTPTACPAIVPSISHVETCENTGS